MAEGPAFRIAGIPIRIETTFLLVAVLLGLGVGSLTLMVAWIAVVTVSVLAHELGHAVAFRRFGREPSIVLQGMGGLTFAAGGLSPGRLVAVSLAGPVTGLLVGLPALFLVGADVVQSATAEDVLAMVVWVNVGWSLVNLLPVLPLDGGNVAASLLDLATGGRGERPARMLSVAVAGGVAIAAYAGGYPFGALFAALMAGENASRLAEIRSRSQRQHLEDGYGALAREEPAMAREAAEELLGGRASRQMTVAAVELLAWTAFSEGGRPAAEAALTRLPPGAAPGPHLRACLALDAGRIDEGLGTLAEALTSAPGEVPWPVELAAARIVAGLGLADELSRRLLARDPSGRGAIRFQAQLHHAGRHLEAARIGEALAAAGSEEPALVAYNVACSWARAGRPDEALAWLERAMARGFADAGLLDADPDLDDLRGVERFRALRGRLS